MAFPRVELGERPARDLKIENLRDLIASIEDNGEIRLGELQKARAELARLEGEAP